MPNEEQARILRMVAEGTVTPAEAGDLLSALEQPRVTPSVSPNMSATGSSAQRTAKRSLVIQIVDGDNTKVNVRVPIGLARAAGRFVPRQALQFLEEREINLEALMEGLQSDDGENTFLEVHDGDSFVRIAME